MNVITDFINNGQKIGIAVSGGMDSMALLHWFVKNQSNLNISITAINIDHNIRKNSYEDTQFVVEYCKKNNIRCLTYKLDLKQSKYVNNTENAARLARYEIFHSLIEKKELDFIATAHHAEDNAETVLMHLFRGSGLKGMCGINFLTKQGIVRPLLYTEKADIKQYIQDNDINYVIDETNLQSDYNRNFLRLEVLPKILMRFPQAINNINTFSKNASEDNSYIEQNVPRLVNKDNEVFIPSEHFQAHSSLINREIFDAITQLGVTHDIESMHIELIKSLINKPAGTRIDIKSKITAIRDYQGITLTDKKINDYYDFEIPFGIGKFLLPNGVLKIELIDKIDTDFLKNSKQLFLDAELLPKDAVIRYRQSGDIINKLGGGGKVSLKDYFIDKKILARLRNLIPLIAKKNIIYAIIGIAVCHDVRITNKTKKIYKLSFVEDDNVENY